ncbi:MAG: permease prefix domain 1-containing protein [Acidobacteriota bacterium]|nr:permease prefix domain 1-containing protein [Acidobacteriota bacterium]
MNELTDALEAQIARWRTWLRRQPALRAEDVDELEGHLRDQIAALLEAGLAADEAFLVAVKRMGRLDAVSREFAREHSDRLWKQLVAAPDDDAPGPAARTETFVVLGLAVAAALAVQLPRLFGHQFGEGAFYALNASLFVLPLLTAYLAWKRGLDRARCAWLAAPFAAAAVAVNAFPFTPGGHTEVLAAMHLPIALWLAVGFAYVGGNWWGNVGGRMDFVRFSGELFIYFVLMALGGGVLTMFTIVSFDAIGLDVEGSAQLWILPSGAMGAIIVGAWLVEKKQSVVENMAPVLTRIFTPLFAALLVALLAAMAWTRSGVGLEREVLIAFDLLLAIVLGLLLYAVSARDPLAPPDLFDRILLVLVVSALIADGVALAAILTRISEFGFSPNRVAALGENLVLLGNLAWSAWLYIRFVSGRGPFAALERWQTAYLPVYAVWAGFVVLAFPLLFRFA